MLGGSLTALPCAAPAFPADRTLSPILEDELLYSLSFCTSFYQHATALACIVLWLSTALTLSCNLSNSIFFLVQCRPV
jgi:hypothetical protein